MFVLCLVFLCWWDIYIQVYGFSSNLPGGSLFGARLGGTGVGIVLKPSNLSDDGVDTSSVVCIRI
jgi:hypothetical protein